MKMPEDEMIAAICRDRQCSDCKLKIRAGEYICNKFHAQYLKDKNNIDIELLELIHNYYYELFGDNNINLQEEDILYLFSE